MAFNAGTVKGTLELSIQRFKTSVRDAIKRFKQLKDASRGAGKDVDGLGSRFKSMAVRFAAGLASIYAVKKGFDILKSTIVGASQAQQDYEQSVQNLRTSLVLAGSTAVSAATAGLEKFATELQRTTSFGDTTVLTVAGLLRTLGVAEDKLKESTKAVLDYSAATGRNAVESAKQFGKTLSGLLGELGETFPQLRSLSAEALKSGEAFEKASDLLGGFAELSAQTTAGALTRLSNTFNDLRKRLGAAFNEFLGPLATKLDKIFQDLVDQLGDGSDGFQKLVDTMRSGFELMMAGVRLLIDGFFRLREYIASAQLSGAYLQQAFVNVIATISEAFLKLQGLAAGLASSIINFVSTIPGLSEGIKQSLQTASDFFKRVEENSRKIDDAMDDLQKSAADVVRERKQELAVIMRQAEAAQNNVMGENAILNAVTRIRNLKVEGILPAERKIKEKKEQQLANEQRVAALTQKLIERRDHYRQILGQETGAMKESLGAARATAEATTGIANAAGGAVRNVNEMASAFDRAATSANAAAEAAAGVGGGPGGSAGASRTVASTTSLDFSDPFRAVAQAQTAYQQLGRTHVSAFAGRTQVNAARRFADSVRNEAQAAVDRAIADYTSTILSELNSAGILDQAERSRIIRERIDEAQRLGVIPSANALDITNMGGLR